MMTSGGKRNPAKLDLSAGTRYGRWRTSSAFLSWSSVYATVPSNELEWSWPRWPSSGCVGGTDPLSLCRSARRLWAQSDTSVLREFSARCELPATERSPSKIALLCEILPPPPSDLPERSIAPGMQTRGFAVSAPGYSL